MHKNHSNIPITDISRQDEIPISLIGLYISML